MQKEPKRLMRYTSDKKIAGVFSGIAKYIGVPTFLVRLAVILLAIVSRGAILPIIIPAYLAMWIFLPRHRGPVPQRGRRQNPEEVEITQVNRTKVLVNHAQDKVSAPVLELVNSIGASIETMMPHLNNVNEKQEPEMAAVKEAALEYFPNALESYLRLPADYAVNHQQSNGTTAQEELLADLELIDDSMKRLIEVKYQNSRAKGLGSLTTLQEKLQRDPTRDVRRSLDNVERRAALVLSSEESDLIQSIKISILAILPQMLASGSGMDQNIFNVRQTALEYLPDAVEKYLSLPEEFRETHTLINGKTAQQTLKEQLELLDNTMKKLMASVYQEDASGLLMHGSFLKEKFAETPFEVPAER